MQNLLPRDRWGGSGPRALAWPNCLKRSQLPQTEVLGLKRVLALGMGIVIGWVAVMVVYSIQSLQWIIPFSVKGILPPKKGIIPFASRTPYLHPAPRPSSEVSDDGWKQQPGVQVEQGSTCAGNEGQQGWGKQPEEWMGKPQLRRDIGLQPGMGVMQRWLLEIERLRICLARTFEAMEMERQEYAHSRLEVTPLVMVGPSPRIIRPYPVEQAPAVKASGSGASGTEGSGIETSGERKVVLRIRNRDNRTFAGELTLQSLASNGAVLGGGTVHIEAPGGGEGQAVLWMRVGPNLRFRYRFGEYTFR